MAGAEYPPEQVIKRLQVHKSGKIWVYDYEFIGDPELIHKILLLKCLNPLAPLSLELDEITCRLEAV